VNEEDAIRRFPSAAKTIKEMFAAGALIEDATEAAAFNETLHVLAGDRTTVIGSRQTKCGCGKSVWLSPKTQSMIEKRGDKPTCVCCSTCMAKMVVRDTR
jgi:hypothetical protein